VTSAARIVSGNRCGHDPRRPRLELERAKRARFPWLIQQLLDRLDGLYRQRHLFPELGARKRSERIEAMVLVGRAIARNTDRLSLRSGRPNGDGTFNGITMVAIASWASLNVQRAFRAVWDLRDAGYVELTQPIEERKDGSRRGLAGIRRLTPKLFDRLGLLPRLKRERRALAEKERESLRAAHVETIAERRRLRRIVRASSRAAALARRTRYQLAEQLAAPPEPAARSVGDLEQRLREWSARNGRPWPGDDEQH